MDDTQEPANARERELGAELISQIFLLDPSKVPGNLDRAIESLCVQALTSYRREVTRACLAASPTLPASEGLLQMELQAEPNQLTVRVIHKEYLQTFPIPAEEFQRICAVVMQPPLPTF